MTSLRLMQQARLCSAPLLAGLLCLAAVPASAAEFGAAQLSYENALLSQFNLINLGNLTSNGATIDGRVVVGGNYTTGNSSVCTTNCSGNTTVAIDSTGVTQNTSGNNGYGAVTVFGNVVGGITTSNGDIDVKGNVSASTYTLNQKGGLNLGGTSQSGTVASGATEFRSTQSSPSGSATNNPSGQTYGFGETMAQVFAPFANANTVASTFSNQAINLQRGIAALPGTPNVKAESIPSNVTIFTSGVDYTYNGKSYGVISTTVSALVSAGSAGLTGISNNASDAATFVIISGDGANYLLPSLTSDSKVLYVFVDATTLKFAGNFAGSILAPLATITQQGGTINGSIVVAGMNQTKELLSTNSFSGDLSGLTGVQFSAVPEPASLLLFAVGVGGVAWARRRRR